MKVLIVEDSAVSRLLLQRTVEGFGHEVVVAADGVEAWSLYPASGAEVVISDWLMPGIDGLELCRRIREHPGPGYPYFIFLTAMAEKEHMVTAMEAGADDFLVKPLDRIALQAGLIAAERVTCLHRQLLEQREELERLNQLLHDDARRDALTLLGNRLRLDEDLHALASRAERYGHSYCAALCDIDYFKRYNDTLGHPAGDGVLRRVAQALMSTARRGDMVYRYGGEEFLIILPEQTLATARIAVGRIREAVERLAIPHPGNQPSGVVTISAGVASFRAGDTGGVQGWLGRADAALYRAKAQGRNRVVADGSLAEPAA